MKALTNERNCSVLASQHSKLIGVIINEDEGMMFTVDSDALIRIWSVKSGICL